MPQSKKGTNLHWAAGSWRNFTGIVSSVGSCKEKWGERTPPARPRGRFSRKDLRGFFILLINCGTLRVGGGGEGFFWKQYPAGAGHWKGIVTILAAVAGLSIS